MLHGTGGFLPNWPCLARGHFLVFLSITPLSDPRAAPNSSGTTRYPQTALRVLFGCRSNVSFLLVRQMLMDKSCDPVIGAVESSKTINIFSMT